MNIKHRFNQIKYYLKKYGILKTIRKVMIEVFYCITGKNTDVARKYRLWIGQNEPTEEELSKQREMEFAVKPKISIVVPMYNTPIKFFEELVDSLIQQTYSNWELCLADGSPEKNLELERV